MKRLVILASVLFIHQYSFCQITLTVVKPGNLVSDTAFIQVGVVSTYQLSSLVAGINNLSTTLTYNSNTKYYEGNIIVTSFKQGDSLNFSVTATDIFSNTKTAAKKVMYDNPPKLTLLTPLAESVARPYLDFAVKCVDMDSCTLNIGYLANNNVINIKTQKIKDSLKGSIDLSVINGLGTLLYFSATDPRNQVTSVSTNIYVDSSSFLTEVFASDTKIVDFNYNKILAQGNGDLSNPVTWDIATKQQTVIPFAFQLATGTFLTPYGAFISGVDSAHYPLASTNIFAYDWNGGQLYSLGQQSYIATTRVTGNYAIWSTPGPGYTNLTLRDLAAKTNVVLQNVGNADNDVASNGLAAYWTNDYNIRTYKNGVTNVLSNNDNNKWNTYPLTDGKNVVYRKHDPCCTNQKYAIYLSDGTNTEVLSDLGTTEAAQKLHYQVNNGFTAFAKTGNGDMNIWIRDSLDNKSQLSFYGDTKTQIDLLNPKGEVLLFYGNKRYLTSKNKPLIPVSSIAGTSFYRDSSWYLAIGRMLYRINSAASITPPPPPVPVSDTALSFDVKKADAAVELDWSTNNHAVAGFIVEKSTDNTSYTALGTVVAKSTGTYSFVDKNPVNGVNYYRLNVFHSDSSHVYGPVKSINFSNATDLKVSAGPNPAQNTLTVTLSSPGAKNIILTIMSLDGNKEYQEQFPVITGNNTRVINISGLKPGIHLVEIRADGVLSTSFKIIKL